ncbi:carbonic anhydrase [uncultured Sphingosinicella sp.]|uniref:carbonic anhydrase n=1 Tax=uncultured Sphingosinicella sp. TaxID=478748 RepID=UPI0030DB7E22|tara:strand:- start:39555 stop:40196 length:642 start_codon:yes stop_codon:yes gene_type:complete
MSGFDELIDGYRRFRGGAYLAQKARYDALRSSQSPKTMIISCSDSRVDPAMIFDVGPGEIFTVRNIANLVPPFEIGGGRHGVSAALEFAVTQLEVENVVVMGHGGCGGVQAALTSKFKGAPAGAGGFIAHWIDLLDEARDRILHDHGGRMDRDVEHALELEAVKVSLKNLRTFPCIPEREATGKLKLIGAYFAIRDGVLHVLDEAAGTFAPAA